MKGNCYQAAADLVLSMPNNESIRLVHGSGLSKNLRKRIDHAWVEIGRLVLDPAIGVTMTAEKYYAVGEVAVYKVFTKKEINVLILKHKHWGPWDSE